MSIKKYIVVSLLVVSIVFNSSFLRCVAEEDTTNGLMIWTVQSRELYGNSYGSQVFGCTDDEAKIIYDTLVDKLDFSVYDDYIVYMKSGGYTQGDSTIFVIGSIGETDMHTIFSGSYYSGASFVSSGFNHVMTEGTYCDAIYVSQFNYKYGVGITGVVSSNVLLSGADLAWSDTGLYGFVNHSGSAFYYTGTLLFSTVPVYCGYDYQASLGLDTNAHLYNKPDIANYCADYSQQAYGYNGKEIVKYTNNGITDKYSRNNELCFDTFLVEKINHPDLLGGTGAKISYSYGDKLFEAIKNDYDNSMKMHFDVELNYRFTVLKDGVLNASSQSYYTTVYGDIEEDIELHTKQNGSYLLDIGKLINAEEYPTLYYYLYGVDNSYVDGWGARTTYNFISSVCFVDPDIIHNIFNLSSNDEYIIDFVDISVSGFVYDYNENDEVVMSNSGQGHVELLSGQNSSFTNTYDTDTGESIKNEDSVLSGNNYYNVVTETDSNGNTYYNYYYYDTDNNTVTPSVGGGVAEIIMTFANPLVLEGVNIDNSSNSSSGGSGGGSSGNIPELVIEDDDYTDIALREDLKDGFGLLDDSTTPEYGDGYISVASSFFNSIDPDASQILMFSLSCVCAVSILRSVFRR